MSTLRIQTAPKFDPLCRPARYKGAHGGRGSGKSHFFAGLLVEDSMRAPGEDGEGLRSVCIREVQKDLSQSAKLLIEDKLSQFDLGEADGFKVFKDVIETPHDGLIIFKGMNNYTADSIKSLENFKRAWIEEGQTMGQTSMDLLRPTIRAEGSEIWASWNPRHKRDPVDAMFRGETKPTGSVVVESVLEQERLDCLANEPDKYDHIWEGGYAQVAEGAYYAASLAKAKEEKRIGFFAPDELMPYRAFFDIGGTGRKADATSIWIAQFIGDEIRVLDYYEALRQPLSAHLTWMRSNGYLEKNTTIWLPHDGDAGEKIIDATYRSACEDAGYQVEVVPNQGRGAAMMRVDMARRLFPKMRFHDETTQGGRDALGWYHEKIDEDRGIGLGPEHDWSSHSADAFGLMAIAYEKPERAAAFSRPINYPKSHISRAVT